MLRCRGRERKDLPELLAEMCADQAHLTIGRYVPRYRPLFYRRAKLLLRSKWPKFVALDSDRIVNQK